MPPIETQPNINPQMTPDEAAASLAFVTQLSQGMMKQQGGMSEQPQETPVEAPVEPEMPSGEEEIPEEDNSTDLELEPEEEEEEDKITPQFEELKEQISDLQEALDKKDKLHSKDIEDIKKSIKKALED